MANLEGQFQGFTLTAIAAYASQGRIDDMPRVPIWQEQRLIESFDVDCVGRLRPQALLGYLLNSAWNHAKGTSYGYEELSSRQQIWVLLKMQIRIMRPPVWGELTTIETWGKRIERLYALRDFTVASSTEGKLVSATSSWIVIDKRTGRPQRLDQKTDEFPWQPGREEMETNFDKVPESKSPTQVAHFDVYFSDIDVNQHVNSARYLEWILDSHSHEHLKARTAKMIELSFLSEALPQDQVTVMSEGTGDEEICSVRRTSDSKDLCRARIEWNSH
jgi:medium-chain acyl-[acyl-carrier-protein] hydrolase